MSAELENRLRSAFEDATARVQAPPEPGWPEDGRARRGAYPFLVVAAAVAATLAVLLTAGLLKGGGSAGDPSFVPRALDVTPVRPARSPDLALRLQDADDPQVVRVRTGEVLGTVRPPAGYRPLWAGQATAAADDRTFFFTVGKKADGRALVARVHVDDRGRPDGDAVLVAEAPRAADLDAVVPSASPTGTAAPSRRASLDGLTASPDGTRLAMLVSTRSGEGVAVWDLRTGRATTWGSRVPVLSVAWGADGSLLWASDASAGRLDPRSRGGALRATRTFAGTGEADRPVLLPGGDRIIVLERQYSVRFVRLPGTPGASPKVLDQWVPDGGDNGGPVVDASGRFVLYLRNGKGMRMNLATGARTPTGLGGEGNKMAGFVW
ncbi:hypothetical protein [Actinomadura verrucosospora]|uniref:Uncharacterized protein n=1 Tax=Actinomadura verrucosospora TaxID=46165 RepID=A0A7D3ZYH3_ACTVE|nr:hypothetical protein [Actinomadura verrucosospora]QKG21384.1 hypothetical protein ACTIVE_3022 [Actinomadura verrucosospora]